MPSPTTKWIETTISSATEIIMDGINSTEGLEPISDSANSDFLIRNEQAIAKLYDRLPYSIQQCLEIAIVTPPEKISEYDLDYVARFRFGDCIDKSEMKVDFYRELNSDEQNSVPEYINFLEEYQVVSSGTKLYIKTDGGYNEMLSLLRELQWHIGGNLSYIKPVQNQKETDSDGVTYQVKYTTLQNQELVTSVHLFLLTHSAPSCPKCNTGMNVQMKRGKVKVYCYNCSTVINTLNEINEFPFTLNASDSGHQIENKLETHLQTYELVQQEECLDAANFKLIVDQEDITIYFVPQDSEYHSFTSNTELFVDVDSYPCIFYNFTDDKFRGKFTSEWDDLNCGCTPSGYNTKIVINGGFYSEQETIHESDVYLCEDCIQDIQQVISNTLESLSPEEQSRLVLNSL